MFSYIGGKYRIGKWIKDFIPTDIETYVEPFSGAFWVYFNMDLAKYPNLKTVVYNDYNVLNANLFACIQHNREFYNYIKDVPHQDRERFKEYQKHAFSHVRTGQLTEPDFQLGLEYVYVITQVFSGAKPETSGFIDLKGKYNSKFNSFRERLNAPKYQNHFQKITTVRNLDFADVMDRYDSKTTYFYLDPPYYDCETYYSNHEFGRQDHLRLVNKLKETDGRWGLSYYPFPELEQWLPDDEFNWEMKLFVKAASAKLDGTQNAGLEVLIKNY